MSQNPRRRRNPDFPWTDPRETFTVTSNGERYRIHSKPVGYQDLPSGWHIVGRGLSEAGVDLAIKRHGAEMRQVRRNPFDRRRPMEWEHMTRAQRQKWNKAHWTPDQYVADKGLARDDRRLAKKHAAAKVVKDRGVGYGALARALGLDAEGEYIDRENPRRRIRPKARYRGRTRSEVDTLSRILSKAGLRHVVARARSRSR